jgi:hypothetical protein
MSTWQTARRTSRMSRGSLFIDKNGCKLRAVQYEYLYFMYLVMLGR